VFSYFVGEAGINAGIEQRQGDMLGGLFDTNLKAELETWLQNKFASACQAFGQRVPVSGLRISPALEEWEAQYFLPGLEENLFVVDEQGGVASELFSPADATQPRPRYRLFSQEPPRLLRENLCQLATAARLILERGWLRRHVSLQPSRPEHRATAEGFDLLVRSLAGEILIAVEIKRSRLELEKLIADLRACSRRGPHAHADCGFPQNHPRHEFYLSQRPAYLWAVAPDGELCLEVKYEEHSLDLEPLSNLPPRSLLEMR
jgi:hypothetical protein